MRVMKKHGSFGIFVNICEGVLAGRNYSRNVAELYILSNQTIDYKHFMNNSDCLAFAALFKEAYLKCFGQALENPVSETESKLLCNQVLEQTGLSIGWKSVKNYSFFVIDPNSVKSENPSIATLDTLARYVLRAPYTTEIKRKNDESHYPYWFLYKEQFNRSIKKKPVKRWLQGILILAVGIVIVVLSVIYMNHVFTKGSSEFSDNFKSVTDESLTEN